jgi:hypothetical protein
MPVPHLNFFTLNEDRKKYLSIAEDAARKIEAITEIFVMYGIDPESEDFLKETPKSEPVITTEKIPSEYTQALTWEDKCLFILFSYGSMYASDLARKVTEIDPEIDIETAEERSAYNLSRLKIAGRIKVVGKSGRKFKYSL